MDARSPHSRAKTVAIKQATMQQLLTGKVRLKKADTSGEQHGKQNYLKNWELQKLSTNCFLLRLEGSLCLDLSDNKSEGYVNPVR